MANPIRRPKTFDPTKLAALEDDSNKAVQGGDTSVTQDTPEPAKTKAKASAGEYPWDNPGLVGMSKAYNIQLPGAYAQKINYLVKNGAAPSARNVFITAVQNHVDAEIKKLTK